MKKINLKLGILAIALIIFPQLSNAQSTSLRSLKSTYNVGDSFQVTLSVNTEGKQINTVAGTVNIPTADFQIIDTKYGSSILNLWVERPRINTSLGTISFTGGVPGGYSGTNGQILSFGLRAKREGSAQIQLSGTSILLNDGMGTEIKNSSPSTLTLTIQKATPLAPAPKPVGPEKLPEPVVPVVPKEIYVPTPDTIPPEDFIPLVSRHPTIAENSYFASFSAVDKDSGVAYYEVEEKPLFFSKLIPSLNSVPTRSEPPYILKIQHWPTEVSVKAYDQAGNFTQSSVRKPGSMIFLSLFVLLLILSSVLLTWIFSNRHYHRRHKKLI